MFILLIKGIKTTNLSYININNDKLIHIEKYNYYQSSFESVIILLVVFYAYILGF